MTCWGKGVRQAEGVGVSHGVGGGFWGGRAQGQQVAGCLSAGPDRKCTAA